MKNPHQPLDAQQKSDLRSAIGQLNWIANITRPEISFQVSSISANITKATIADIKETNKIIKFVKSTPGKIKFPLLDAATVKILMYADASFNSDEQGGSQGGYIILLSDKNNKSCPIAWKSNKIRRVARSTLAAETLAFADGCDAAMNIFELASESSFVSTCRQVLGFTDNRSLYEAVNTSSLVADRRLRVEVSMLRQMSEHSELNLQWINTHDQLADILTKRGVSHTDLMTALQEGRLPQTNQ